MKRERPFKIGDRVYRKNKTNVPGRVVEANSKIIRVNYGEGEPILTYTQDCEYLYDEGMMVAHALTL